MNIRWHHTPVNLVTSCLLCLMFNLNLSFWWFFFFFFLPKFTRKCEILFINIKYINNELIIIMFLTVTQICLPLNSWPVSTALAWPYFLQTTWGFVFIWAFNPRLKNRCSLLLAPDTCHIQRAVVCLTVTTCFTNALWYISQSKYKIPEATPLKQADDQTKAAFMGTQRPVYPIQVNPNTIHV